MADETKRPTAQDIDDFRQVLDVGMRQSLGSDTTTPDHAAVVWQMWVRFTGVLDYAESCLRAEEEAERVPEDARDDPEARVRAMSVEEVEAALAGRGVGAWYAHPLIDGKRFREWDEGWDAIAPDGIVYRPEPSTAAYDYSQTGDTTTEAGRMECSRRLLAHLLREEVGHG